jgi:hypothetical protein
VLNESGADFMKTQNFKKTVLIIATVTGLLLLAGNVMAQDSSTTAVASQSAPVQLSPAVSQVLQLAQAKVSDGTIVAYIQNSGTIYGLDASQIVYLRQQGVSDTVVTTMLNQRTRVMASAAQTAPQAATTAQNDSSATGSDQTSTAVAQPTVTYVTTAPSSQVYVIPDTQTYYYPYYPYYAWPYPAVSLSFGFGGRWGGGYYHGGGWHGGGGAHHH